MNIQRGFRTKMEKYLNLDKSFDMSIKIQGSANFDIKCFVLDEKGKIINKNYIIDSNNMHSLDEAVCMRGGFGNVVFSINFLLLHKKVEKLAFYISTESHSDMSSVSKIQFNLVQDGSAVLEMEIGDNEFHNEKTILVSEIYKKDGWRIAAIFGGYNDSIAGITSKYMVDEGENSQIEEVKSTTVANCNVPTVPLEVPECQPVQVFEEIKEKDSSIKKNENIIPIIDIELQGKLDAILTKLERYFPEHKVFAFDSIDKSLRERAVELAARIGYKDLETMLKAYGYSVISGDEVKAIRNSVIYLPGNEPDIVKPIVESIIKRLEEAFPDKMIKESLQTTHRSLSKAVSGMYQWLGYSNQGEFLKAYGYNLDSSIAGGRPKNDLEFIEELKRRYEGKPLPKAIGILMYENPDLKGQIKTLQNQCNELFGIGFKEYLIGEGLLQAKGGQVNNKTQNESPKKKSADDYLKIMYDELDNSIYGTYEEARRLLKDVILKVNSKGQIYIAGSMCDIDNLSIPYGISKIANKAFMNNTTLKSVKFPDSLIEIGESAFYGCTLLEEVDIPATVEKLGDFSFANCSSLTTLRLGKGKYYYNLDVFKNSPCQELLFDKIEGASDESDFEYEISKSKGATIKRYLGNSNNVIIPSTIEGAMVSSIDREAFKGCQFIVEVTMPDSIKTLGNNAFKDCISLKRIRMSENISNIMTGVFSGCIGLEEVNIPNGVTELKASTFADSPLRRLFVGDSLDMLSTRAFNQEKCEIHISVSPANDNLYSTGKEIILKRSKKLVAFLDFASKSYEIPEDTVEVSENAFRNMKNLESVAFPSSLRVIESRAFAQTGLRNIIFNEGLERIEKNAFEFCEHLTSVIFPDSLKKIGQGCFLGCGIASIKIPENVSEIGFDAFSYKNAYGRVGIKKLEIDRKNKYYYSDGICLYSQTDSGRKAIQLISTVHKYTFKENTVEIGDKLFSYEWDVREINLPEGLIRIGNYAFEHCEGLNEINIPQSVREIGDYAFTGTNITEFILPSNLEKLGNHALCIGNSWNPSSKRIKDIVIEDSKAFFVEGKALYEMNENQKLSLHVYYGKKKEFSISKETVKICSGAFERSLIEDLHIPNTISDIEEGAFNDCTNLTRLYVDFAVPENGVSQAVIYMPSTKAEAREQYMDCIRVDQEGNVFNFVKYDSLFETIALKKDKILIATDRLKSAIKLVPLYEEKYLKYLRRYASDAVKIVIEYDDLQGLDILAKLEIFTTKNIDEVIELVNTAQKPELLSYLMNFKNQSFGTMSTEYDI